MFALTFTAAAALPLEPSSERVPPAWWGEIREEIAASEYRITWQEESVSPQPWAGWQAPNRAQGLRAYFTGDGFRVVPRKDGAPAWEWGLTFVDYGRAKEECANEPSGGTDLRAPRPAEGLANPRRPPLVDGNTIAYERRGLVETYVNDARGLEQTFVIHERPETATRARRAGSAGASCIALDAAGGTGETARTTAENTTELAPTSISHDAAEDPFVHIDLALGGTLVPAFSTDGKSIDFASDLGVKVLRYGSLAVVDARGAVLPSRMEAISRPGLSRGVRLVYDDRDAVYPVVVDPLVTMLAWTGEGNQAGARFGVAAATAGDVNGDGFSDLIVGAPRFDNGQTDEGRAYVFLGSPSGPAGPPVWTLESNQASAQLGASAACAGDVNGDGYADVVVGANRYDNVQTDEGRVYVFLGSPSGPAASPSWTAERDQANAFFGTSVAGAGDVNGDGFSDIVVGAFAFDNGQADEGAAFVYLGSASGLAASPAWTAESDAATGYFGYSTATAGDVNGDSYADIVVGAPLLSNGQVNEGRAYLYLGSASGLSAAAAWTVESDQIGAQIGVSVATAGDTDGDGYADVVVGASGYDNGQTNEGRAFVYRGLVSGLAASPAWTVESDQASAQMGVSVSTAGDMNGDGYADVVVGSSSYGNDQSGEGRIFLYLGSAAGLSPTPSWTAESDQSGSDFGFAAASAGDVNGDGFGDLIVGANQFDSGEVDEGRVYLYLGSGLGPTATPGWIVESNQAAALLGSVASAGDVNGDGYTDVIVGAPLFDNGQTNEGQAFLYLGSPAGLATTAAWTAQSNQADVEYGSHVATAGDLNGDGYADVLVGAPFYDTTQTNVGRVYAYYGSPSGPVASPSLILTGDQQGGELGYSLSTAGDVNGDGYSDVIVGALGYNNVESDEGRAYIYMGSAAGLALTPAWTTESNQASAFYGYPVGTAGDVDGDGFSDVVVGAYAYDNGQIDEGRAYLYLGSAKGVSTTPAWTAESNQASANFGVAVGTAGDVNGDGFSDVIATAERYDNVESNEGRAYVYLGSAAGLSASPVWTAENNASNSRLGHSAAAAGDVNGDGFGDVIVGAPNFANVQFDKGKAYVYLGSAAGLATSPVWTFEGDVATAWFGDPVAPAGDVNGDGFADIIVGAEGYGNDQAQEGRAYVFYGGGGCGVDRIPRQARINTTTPVALLGKSDVETQIRLRAWGRTPAGRGSVRLEWEVKPLGTPFDGIGIVRGAEELTSLPGIAGSAASFNEAASGLSEGTFYHWRARSASASPFFPRSPWLTLAGNTITETKFRTSGCVDRDGDGYGDLGDPSCLSLVADCNDHDPALWATPGETRDLVFTSKTTLAWDTPADLGSVPALVLYDTLRSGVASNFLLAECVETDDGPNRVATDTEQPTIGRAFYYLTRAQNACPGGTGTLGTTSAGATRPGASCP